MEYITMTVAIIMIDDSTYMFKGPKEFHNAYGDIFKSGKETLYDNMRNIKSWAYNSMGAGVVFTIA